MDPLLAAGTTLIGIGCLVFVFSRKRGAATPEAVEHINLAVTNGKIRVLDGESLLGNLRLSQLTDMCRDRMGFDAALFQKDCLPVIHRAAEWVQMLPASESHHHAQPGGLLIHMMESSAHALRFRQGYLLPVGAAPEEIPARKHRWTYAVFLAALLHDIGKPVSSVNVRLTRKSSHATHLWEPLAGSMIDQGVEAYALDFDLKNRDYELHKRLPIVLFQRLVPPHVLSWLAQDAQLMGELTCYLSGDESYSGALREIVTKADSESVRLNLMQGPRTRFASAKSVPLIERLMQALRLMLEEGRLSLNRAGAHGWVHDGKIWFVSKRLADEVRQFLTERESGEGIPGRDKNDRIFDTWQEYGALVPTPENRAVWQVLVELDEGWSQRMTVLCFELDKLFSSTSLYPDPVKGKITPLTGESRNEDVEEDEATEQPAAETSQAPGPQGASAGSEAARGPKQDTKQTKSQPVTPPSFALPPLRATSQTPRTLPQAQDKPSKAEDFLDDEDAAKPQKKKSAPQAAALKPIAPAGQNLPKPGGKKKEPSEAALRFMRWIQEGLAEGAMSYNRADAMIHFVPEGMMLVSPVIFRKFAEQFGEDGTGTPSDREGSRLGTGIQRQVTNAGWNLVAGEKKSNILRYLVVGQDGEGKKLISGVVIVEPERFVNPLPPNNPCIARFDKPLENE